MIQVLFERLIKRLHSIYSIQIALLVFWGWVAIVCTVGVVVEYFFSWGSLSTPSSVSPVFAELLDNLDGKTRGIATLCVTWVILGLVLKEYVYSGELLGELCDFIFLAGAVALHAMFAGNIYGNYGPPGRWLLDFAQKLL